MKKHHTGIQGSIDLIKSNPDIFYLIGFYTFYNGSMLTAPVDFLTTAYTEIFKKFRPIN
jgi:hypothetical protein